MEWSKPKWQDVPPNHCFSYAGVSLMENWFFAGGGNNKIDMCEAFVSLVISSIFLWLLLNEQ
ncbi:unnamed protein product [Musa banksii]